MPPVSAAPTQSAEPPPTPTAAASPPLVVPSHPLQPWSEGGLEPTTL